ncbi:hypothetical protein [Poseidonocella sp. HB161398]|uniref:hypothetical protein n=1 Tax=Poseidonocella sp. HB161398 TaxID=2320855 RepID=UPI001F0F43D1|nr:hypothetical protein [Poseidonocella sp. HB161398]
MEFNAATDWRNAFLDGSVALPDGFPAPVVHACGWITAPIAEDAEFFGKWRGWLEAAPELALGLPTPPWMDLFGPETLRDMAAIPPPPECQWDTSPLPGAEAR